MIKRARLRARHARHGMVRDDQVELLVGAEDFKGCGRRGHLRGEMPKILQHCRRSHADERIVIHHKHRQGILEIGSGVRRCVLRCWRRRRRIFGNRQPEGHRRPLPLMLDRSRIPPDCAARPCTMERPRPVPFPGPLVVKNGSVARLTVASSIPSPVSETEIRT